MFSMRVNARPWGKTINSNELHLKAINNKSIMTMTSMNYRSIFSWNNWPSFSAVHQQGALPWEASEEVVLVPAGTGRAVRKHVPIPLLDEGVLVVFVNGKAQTGDWRQQMTCHTLKKKINKQTCSLSQVQYDWVQLTKYLAFTAC